MFRFLIKGIIVAITVVGAITLFQQSIGLVIEIVKNYRQILEGIYEIPSISDASFYSFWGYATTLAIGFNLIPSKNDGI